MSIVLIEVDDLDPELSKAYIEDNLGMVDVSKLVTANAKIKTWLTPEQHQELKDTYQYVIQGVTYVR